MTYRKLGILSLQYYCYPDEVGGAWKYTYEVNKRLAARGHDVFLITCKPDARLPDYEMVDGIHYYRIGAAESKDLAALRRSLRSKINAILDRNAIRLIHVHNPLVGFLALLDPRLWPIPKVYHFHSLWFDEEKINQEAARADKPGDVVDRIKLGFRLNIIRGVEWTCFLTAHSVLFLSEYSARKFRAFFPLPKRRLRVISGAVDVETFRPPAVPVAAVRGRLGLPGDRPVLLTVRRLVARMGLENLVRAAGIVAQNHPAFLLVIAGHGPLENKLKSLIAAEPGLQERVRMPGKLSPAELTAYYQAADVFILPTTDIEGFGLATAEALASGLPVLGTPVGGTVEILKAIDDRLLFAGTSPEDLAGGIASFLRDPQPFLDLKPKCRAEAVAKYGWESVVDRLEEEFDHVVA